MIPKIIHQIWIGPKKMPEKYMDTWKALNPDWTYMRWTDKEIAEHFPKGFKNQKHINEIEEWAGKADMIRYEILYKFGGIYVDADSICTNGLDDHFLDHSAFAGFENEQCRGNLIANGYMGSTKGNSFIKKLVDEIYKMPSVTQRITGRMAWQNVGPLFFTEMVMKHQPDISIYPSFVFIPEHYSGITYKGSGKSYSKQLWGSTHELRDPEYYNKL
jgi:mannosyltransferase OCH1-like enzyme